MVLTKKLLHNIIKHAEILKAVALATYKEWAAYRSHAMVSILVGPLYYLVQIYIWKAVYSNKISINGLSLEQMLTYFGVAALINYLIMDFADWNLQMLIHTGKFSTYMLRPMSHIYFAFSQKVGHRILGFIFEFLPVYLIFLLIFKITIVPPMPVWAAISIALGFLMMFFINYCIGITAFWLTKTSGIRRMFLFLRNILSGVFLPLILFPEAIQKVFFFLPFQFIAYVPIRAFIGSYQLGGISLDIPAIVGIQAMAVLIMGVFTVIFFKIGTRKFTGVGT